MSNKIELDMPHWGHATLGEGICTGSLAHTHLHCKLDQFHKLSELGVLVDFKTGLLKIKPTLVHLCGDKDEINQDP